MWNFANRTTEGAGADDGDGESEKRTSGSALACADGGSAISSNPSCWRLSGGLLSCGGVEPARAATRRDDWATGATMGGESELTVMTSLREAGVRSWDESESESLSEIKLGMELGFGGPGLLSTSPQRRMDGAGTD